MLISKTPFRMSFIGGGSDMKTFYSRKRGAVISTAIDKYVYVSVNKKFDNDIRLAYSINEEVSNVEELQHPLVRSTLKHMGVCNGIEITSIADIPSKGTGLGSSSSFTVGLLNALSHYLNEGNNLNNYKEWLARNSCHVEIDLCKEPIGKQDQYAAAYGGFNLIEFHDDEAVSIKPINISKTTIKEFQDNLIVFFTGITRSASQILQQQTENISNNSDIFFIMSEMVDLAYVMKDDLECGRLDNIGKLLDEAWSMKKKISKDVSTHIIDDLYSRGRNAGAYGGKLLGAGTGGFLIFYAHKDAHANICKALPDLQKVDFGFDSAGSQLVFDDRRE